MWNVQMDWGNSVCFLPSSVLVFGQWIGGGKTAAATGKLKVRPGKRALCPLGWDGRWLAQAGLRFKVVCKRLRRLLA